MNKLEKLKIDIWEGLGKHSKGQFLSRERLHRIIDTAYTLGQQSNLPKADVVAIVMCSAERDELQDLINDALITEGGHHKQWYLEKIADKLGLLTIIEHEQGIAP